MCLCVYERVNELASERERESEKLYGYNSKSYINRCIKKKVLTLHALLPLRLIMQWMCSNNSTPMTQILKVAQVPSSITFNMRVTILIDIFSYRPFGAEN